jgi:hypothetical protein
MIRSNAVSREIRGPLAGLCLLAALSWSCGGAPARPSGGTGGDSGKGGDSGSGGGSGGGAGSGGSGGSSGSAGTGATGGSSGTGGAGGDTGGSGGSGGAGGSVDASMTTSLDDGGATAADTGGSSSDSSPPSSDNPCYNPKAIKNRTLPGLSVKDFCDAYEKYCMYTPDGSLMSKCGPGQPVGPLYKDRMDCETKYGMASASAKACRAGQMCVNAPAGLIVNACSHATGYCAGACK